VISALRRRLWIPFLAFAVFAAASAWSTPLPASKGAPAVGTKAPDFTLPDANGSPVTLSRLFGPAGSRKGSWVLLVFYRGYW
jgi:cytochrome oxidase Cu insertion factor (SCO1/SenC/PrrC family)